LFQVNGIVFRNIGRRSLAGVLLLAPKQSIWVAFNWNIDVSQTFDSNQRTKLCW